MQSGGLRTKGITKSSRPGEPLISVVTVVYNGAETLGQTIRSVTEQTYGNVEYVIIDGGSTDGTLDIIRKHEDKIDFWRSEPDGGIYDAMNKGIALATGDFLIFLGADDVFIHPSTLGRCARRMTDAGTNYYGDAYFSRSRLIYDYKFSALKLCVMNICHQSVFYSRESLKGRRFDTGYPIYADWELNIELWSASPFTYIPETVCVFSEEGSSSRGDGAFLRDQKKIIRRNFGMPALVLYMLLRGPYNVWHFFEHLLSSRRYRFQAAAVTAEKS